MVSVAPNVEDDGREILWNPFERQLASQIDSGYIEDDHVSPKVCVKSMSQGHRQ